MTALRTIISAVLEAMAPDGTLTRMRFRTSLDMLLTLGLAVLAAILVLGYQFIGRWARHTGGGR